MKPVVLLSAPYMLPYANRFQPIFEHYQLEIIQTPLNERMEEAEILAYAGQFDGAICGDDRYTARALEACAPRLKVISKWGSGVDSIDPLAAERLGIQVFRTPNAFTLAVADTVLGYMLAFVRQHPKMDQAMKQGRWEKIPGRSLSECVVGVVGVGNIGKAVLRRVKVFGAQLLGNDIVEIAPDFIAENGVEMTSLPDLLRRADFVSLNCDLNPASFHLIGPEQIDLMKPGAYLINAARGALIDEPALVEALQEHRIAGAALDVFEVEPLPADHPFLKMDHVLLAPHNANSSPAAWRRVHLNTIRNLLIGLRIDASELDAIYQQTDGNL